MRMKMFHFIQALFCFGFFFFRRLRDEKKKELKANAVNFLIRKYTVIQQFKKA